MKFVFLDRDGVINRFPGKGLYVTQQSQFEFLPGSIEAIRSLTQAGIRIAVVSNQGCVSRKLITRQALADMTDRMLAEIEKASGRIQGVYYCEHQKSDLCDCKKPKTKLFLKALEGLPVDMKNVYFVGDSEEDLEAGLNLGCRKVLVLSGRLKSEDLASLSVRPDAIKNDLLEAARWILAERS